MDNSLQFSSGEFQELAKDYGFKHTTTSPHYPQANGEVEIAVQTVKKLWGQNGDKYLALLDYRMTPLPDIDLSPAQLLSGCQLRNKLPMTKSLIQPATNNQQHITKFLEKAKEDQKNIMTELQPDTKVHIQPWKDPMVWKPATVVKHHHTLRSHVVQAEGGSKYHCNRQHQQVCLAPGHGRLNTEIPSRTAQSKEPPIDAESNQPTIPAKENIRDTYVTQSGQKVVDLKQLDL